MAKQLDVEVVYAKADQQTRVNLLLDADVTVEQAIKASGILDQFAEIDLAINKLGIFGKSCKLSDLLHNGDRVEIYRPLKQDPMEARRKRALDQ